ncbi:MAG: hypothetical protein P8X84_01420 [Candidatus Bathyarchaeota archaeon]
MWFHQLFFTSGTWTFYTSDTLIRLFPMRFVPTKPGPSASLWLPGALRRLNFQIFLAFLS